jgi:hypothetical protein
MRSLVGALLLITASTTRASGSFELYGPDPRSVAMANASAADDQGVALAHTNPASPASSRQARFFAGEMLSAPALSVELDSPRARGDRLAPAIAAPVLGVTLGFVLPVDLVLKDRLAVAATAFFPTAVLIRARADDPARPFFLLYDSATERYDVSVALALRVVDGLAVGAGGRLAAGQTGAVTLAVDPSRRRLTDQTADLFQYAKFAPTVGVRAGPLDLDAVRGSLGLVYREPTSFDIGLPAGLALEGLDVEALLDLQIIANYAPRTLTAGVEIEILRQLRLLVDAQAAFWSQAPSPHAATRVDLGGDGLDGLGLEDGLDAPADDQERVVPPGFSDVVVLRVGVEWRGLNDVLALRAGYQLRPTPVPDQTSGTNIADARTHVIAAGAGLRALFPAIADGPFDVDLGWQAHLLEPRRTEKDDARDPVGPWTASGVVHVLAIGAAYRW